MNATETQCLTFYSHFSLSDIKNLLSAPLTIDSGGVNTCVFTIRIKLTSSFPGRLELPDIMAVGFIDLVGLWRADCEPKDWPNNNL